MLQPRTYKIREFFVKWAGRSNWENSWVAEITVMQTIVPPPPSPLKGTLCLHLRPPPPLQLEVHQPLTLRSYVRTHNMETPPPIDLPAHLERKFRKRSVASHQDEKVDEREVMLLKAGIKPQWLQIHRIINKRSKPLHQTHAHAPDTHTHAHTQEWNICVP